MALLESLPLPLGTPLTPFSLPDAYGKIHSPDDFSDKKILVIIFMCNHCPYVKAVINRLVKIDLDYREKDVQLIGINSNDFIQYPEDSPEAMKAWSTEKGIEFPYLIDEDQSVARAYKAQCTPDIYVFDSTKKLAYHGRIDDNWKDKSQVTQHELRNALNQLLADQPAPEVQHPTIGCSIKWKN